MGWLQKLGEWRTRRAMALIEKQNPIGPLTVVDSGGSGKQPWTTNTEAHLKVYMVNVYAYAAITAISMDVAATPLLVQKKTVIDGQIEWETQAEGELFDLFNQANMSQETWSDLTQRWIIGLLSAGDSYMLYDNTDTEFYYARPDWVHTVTDAMGRITGYNISNAGKTVNHEVPDVIHLKMANPAGEFYGLPPSAVVRNAIMTAINLDAYLNNFFKNNATAGLVFSSDQKLDETDKKKIKKQLRIIHQGIQNAFKSLVLDKGTTVTRLSQSLKDLIPNEIDQRVMRQVLAVYQVPPIKIGVLDGASYSNANKQDQVYERNAVEPRRRSVEQALNHQFVKPRFGDEWRVHYDRSEVPGLQEDKNDSHKRVREDWKAGLLRFNEARADIDKEPVDEDEGGNEFFTAPASFMISPPANGDDDDEGQKQVALYDPHTLKLTKQGEETQRERHERRLTKNEKRFAKIVTAYFNGQVNRLIARLNEVTGNGKFMSLLELYIGKDNDEIPKNLFNLETENTILIRDTNIAITQSIEAGGNAAVSDFNLPIDFNPNDPRVQMMAANFAQKITIINVDSQKQVQQLLIDSFERGDSIPEISKNLREMYAGWTDKTLDHNRSLRISRTEMNGFVNGGGSEAYLQAGLGKEWLATLDGETRMDHVIADGQRVGPKEKFMVGSDLLAYPSDPAGSPENIINCRCTMIPVVID